MALKTIGTIAIPDAARSAFDHSAFDARSLDIDHCNGRLYAACDDATLVEMSSISGEVANVWPIAGPPDVTFFNPATGLVHVAIGEPGLVETFDPRTGHGMQTMTGADATHKMRRNGSSTTRSMRIAARW